MAKRVHYLFAAYLGGYRIGTDDKDEPLGCLDRPLNLIPPFGRRRDAFPINPGIHLALLETVDNRAREPDIGSRIRDKHTRQGIAQIERGVDNWLGHGQPMDVRCGAPLYTVGGPVLLDCGDTRLHSDSGASLSPSVVRKPLVLS